MYFTDNNLTNTTFPENAYFDAPDSLGITFSEQNNF